MTEPRCSSFAEGAQSRCDLREGHKDVHVSGQVMWNSLGEDGLARFIVDILDERLPPVSPKED